MPTPPAPNSAEPKGDRVAKLLARAGIASRREIERMIDERRVALDGKPLETPATILTSLAGITVDGRPVAAPEPPRLFLYHKPPGLLVTERDPAGRATIYDRLPADLPRTVPVGRLDLSTEGLLLLTTDGGLKRTLELPATGVERTYRARAYGNVTQAMLEDLIEGVEVEGIRYGPIDANLERRTGANVWIELTLTEGKNREVRRVLEYLGLEVSRLIRTRYGPFVLGDLPPGEVGEVTPRDLTNFTRTLGSTRRAKGADLDHLVAVLPRNASAPGAGDRPARPESGGSAPRGAARAAKTPPRPQGEGRTGSAGGRPTTDTDRRASPDRAATPRAGTGWGSRTRPSRPPEAAEGRRGRGTFRLADEPQGGPPRPGRDEARARPQPSRSNPRGDRPIGGSAGARSPGEQRREAGPRARPDDQRASSPAGRPSGTTPRSTPDQRRAKPDRTASDPRPNRPADGDVRTPRSSGVTRRDDRAPAKPGKGPSGGRGHPPRPPKGKPGGKR